MGFAKLQKKWGADTFFVEDPSTIVKQPFGILPLDVATGGGMQSGNIIEIFGNPSTGKSLVALSLCQQVQASGGWSVYIDTEYALEADRCANLGIDISNKFTVPHFDSLDDVFEFLKDATSEMVEEAANMPVVVVVDSVAALPTNQELDGKGDYGPQARVISKGLRLLRARIAKSKIMLVCINQVREKMNVLYGDATDTPGGRALKFYAGIRLQTSSGGKLRGKDLNPFGFDFRADDIVGVVSRMDCVKNKIVNPFRSSWGVALFKTGFHPALSTFWSMRNLKMLSSKSKTYTIKGTKLSFTKADFLDFFDHNKGKIRKAMRLWHFGE